MASSTVTSSAETSLKNSRKSYELENEEIESNKKLKQEEPKKVTLPTHDNVRDRIKKEWTTALDIQLQELKPYGAIVTAPLKDGKPTLVVGQLDPQLLKELCWYSGFVIMRDFKSLEREEMIKAAKGLGDILEWPDYGMTRR
jgi:hypothetical protein